MAKDAILRRQIRCVFYVIASAQHNSPFGSEPVEADTQQLPSIRLPAGDVLRALMVAMDLWVTQGVLATAESVPES